MESWKNYLFHSSDSKCAPGGKAKVLSNAFLICGSLRSEGRRPERSEVNKFVVPRELSRANSSEKYIYIHIYMYIIEDVRALAWQQRNKASMTSERERVIEHGKQR